MKWLDHQYSEIGKQCHKITWDSLPTTPVTWQAESRKRKDIQTDYTDYTWQQDKGKLQTETKT